MYLQYRKALVNSYLRTLQRSVLMTYGIISYLLINNVITEPRGPVIGSAALYCGGPEFKFLPTGRVL